MEIMGTIFKVVQEIAKAASKARRNRRRCQELADRLPIIGNLLRDSNAANDSATRQKVLKRLRAALADGLKLVHSCRRRGLLFKLLAAGRDSGRFDDVNRRINDCLTELIVANDARRERQDHLAASGNHPRTNANGGSGSRTSRQRIMPYAMTGTASTTTFKRTTSSALTWINSSSSSKNPRRSSKK